MISSPHTYMRTSVCDQYPHKTINIKNEFQCVRENVAHTHTTIGQDNDDYTAIAASETTKNVRLDIARI